MEIRNIVLYGSGKSKDRIRDLLSQPGLEVTESDDHFLDADLVIAIHSGQTYPGPTEVKQGLFQKADGQAKEDTIFATTASFGITQIASTTKRPSRFIGLNFVFNPFQDKSVVQLVKGLETSGETMEACKTLLSKTPALAIEVQDAPGLILDRVMASVINEAATMLLMGLATIEDIDKVAKSCLNWPAGPFEFADRLGVDEVLATLEVLSREEGPQFRPCRLIKQMVTMRHFGRKTAKGFYSY